MRSMGIDRPIFIVGPHRSGTTLLYGIIAAHADVGYLNRYNHRFPGHPKLAQRFRRMMRAHDLPVEAQRVWDHEWKLEDDVMGAEDADPDAVAFYRRTVSTVLAMRGCSRLVAKYPRLSMRLDWLDAIFPNAIFVHMVRDWRAVVNSTVSRKVKRQKRGGGWFGVRIPGWREMDDLPHELAAGRVFRVATQQLEEGQQKYGTRFHRISYEDLCREPISEIRRLAETCGLEWTDAFEKSIPQDLTSANHKWKERLDMQMVERIRAEAPEFYARYEEH